MVISGAVDSKGMFTAHFHFQHNQQSQESHLWKKENNPENPAQHTTSHGTSCRQPSLTTSLQLPQLCLKYGSTSFDLPQSPISVDSATQRKQNSRVSVKRQSREQLHQENESPRPGEGTTYWTKPFYGDGGVNATVTPNGSQTASRLSLPLYQLDESFLHDIKTLNRSLCFPDSHLVAAEFHLDDLARLFSEVRSIHRGIVRWQLQSRQYLKRRSNMRRRSYTLAWRRQRSCVRGAFEQWTRNMVAKKMREHRLWSKCIGYLSRRQLIQSWSIWSFQATRNRLSKEVRESCLRVQLDERRFQRDVKMIFSLWRERTEEAIAKELFLIGLEGKCSLKSKKQVWDAWKQMCHTRIKGKNWMLSEDLQLISHRWKMWKHLWAHQAAARRLCQLITQRSVVKTFDKVVMKWRLYSKTKIFREWMCKQGLGTWELQCHTIQQDIFRAKLISMALDVRMIRVTLSNQLLPPLHIVSE